MKRNKISTSIRLSTTGLTIWKELARRRGNTKTAVLERLLREEANREGISFKEKEV